MNDLTTNELKKSLRESIPLDPQKILKKTISSTLGTLVLFLFLTAIVFIIFATSSNEGVFITFCFPILLVLFILNIVVSFLYQKAYYRTYFYDIADGFLIIKKGAIIPKETTLPFEKINDIYVDQDLLDKVFGLYDVHFSTATVESGLHAHIDGLTTENAKKLKTIILQAITKSLDARDLLR